MAIDNKYLHSDITSSILQAFYTVLKRLPLGLSIDVYKRALELECEYLGLKTERDKEIIIHYREKSVGSLIIDMVINNSVIVKITKDENINEQSILEVKNQLRISEYEVSLILNTAQDGQHKRYVFTNDKKNKTEKDWQRLTKTDF